jgi:hypothetical protein
VTGVHDRATPKGEVPPVAVAVAGAGSAALAALAAAVPGRLAAIRRAAPAGALLFTVLAAHVALAPHLAVLGVAPDVPLVAVVAVSAGRGRRAGAAFGFAAGLGADLFLATPPGTSALAYTLVGHVVGGAAVRCRPGAAAALCTPASRCFACRTGRRSAAPPSERRRAAVRRAVVLTAGGVGAGRVAVVLASTAFGGRPVPGVAGLLRIAGVALVSAPLGPPVLAAVRRRPGAAQSWGRP